MNSQEQVRKVVQQYVDACMQGSVDRLKAIFHPQALMSGYLAGQALIGSPEPFFQAVQAQPAPAHSGADYLAEITSIEIEGDVACATLKEQGFAGMNFTNFFHLMRTDGNWKIVSKTFTST